MWNLKCTIIPVITGAIGLATRSFRKNLEAIPGKQSIDSLQDSYAWNISHNTESTAMWSLKPERWSPLVQKKYQEEKACDKRHPYRLIIIIIISVLLNADTCPPILLFSVFLPLLLSESTVFLNTSINIVINKLIYKLLSVYRFIHSVMPDVFGSLQIFNFLSLRGLISEGFSNFVLKNKYFYK